MASSSSSSSHSLAASRRGRSARQAPFFRDLATPIPSHRGVSRFASGASPSAAPSATPPPPPIFTLDDRFAAADFSPDPTASDLLPVASSPSPRAAASRSPPWDLSRGKVSLSPPGSPVDGVVEPARKEVLALPPPASPGTPPPATTAEAQSPVSPAQAPARTEPVANGGEVEREEWVTIFGFSIGDTNLVLREFEKCGVILRHHSGPKDGNWIHILYQAAKGPVAIGSAIPNSITPEEPKVAVPEENGEMADIQDKEVSMEGLFSISAYDQWTPLSVSGQLPKPRYKHGAAVVQQKMYVFGGNHNGRYLGDIQVLDFKTLSWSKLEAKSQAEPSESAGAVPFSACAGHSVIQWGNKILCLAGHTREPEESLSVKEFDPQTCTWSTLRTYGRSPSSRGGQSVTLIGDTLVVFGGEGHGRSLLNDLHILDLETMTWDEFETTGTPPSPRSEHAAACFAERYLLIFGGGSHSTCFSDLHLLDTQTMEWSRPKQQGVTPETRAGHAGVTIGEYWFITGGGNSRKGVSDTLVLNMSTYEWSVLTDLEARAPPTSEGSSLVMYTINGENFLVSFGGYSGRYSNQAYALKASFKPSVLSQQIDEAESNGFAPISVAANSSRKVIFEIEELKDVKPGNRADNSKTLGQVATDEQNQIEERLNHERLQSLRLKQELADVENRNTALTEELHLVRDQLSIEQTRASKLENEISEIQQRLQKMDTLEKEFESLRSELDSTVSEEEASIGNQTHRSRGFWRWNG